MFILEFAHANQHADTNGHAHDHGDSHASAWLCDPSASASAEEDCRSASASFSSGAMKTSMFLYRRCEVPRPSSRWPDN